MTDVVLQGDCLTVLQSLPDCSVNTCVTSPPYWGLRDYHVEGQLGLEQTPQEYVDHMVAVFHEVKRVLRDDGTLWLNLGDCYGGNKSGGRADTDHMYGKESDAQVSLVGQNGLGMKSGVSPKNLIGIPWRVAFALQADEWIIRSEIIWAKPNPMPESVTDRCTKSHEYIFLLAKSEKYYYDADAIKENSVISVEDVRNVRTKHNGEDAVASKRRGFDTQCGTRQPGYRNKRDVWTVATAHENLCHFAVFPAELIRPCILAGCPEGGTVLDPFLGSGTTAMVAKDEGRHFIGIELNPKYIELAKRRINCVHDSLLAVEKVTA